MDVGMHVRMDKYALCLLLMNRACQAGEEDHFLNWLHLAVYHAFMTYVHMYNPTYCILPPTNALCTVHTLCRVYQ